jgi:RimJ/RimL family protein N-acetyltransferase
MGKIELKENELYQEIDLLVDGVKIGTAEVDLNGKTLSRLMIDTAFQDKGYGQEIVRMLIEKYGCDNLWVVADNERAIHVYEKLGFRMERPTMFSMTRNRV